MARMHKNHKNKKSKATRFSYAAWPRVRGLCDVKGHGSVSAEYAVSSTPTGVIFTTPLAETGPASPPLPALQPSKRPPPPTQVSALRLLGTPTRTLLAALRALEPVVLDALTIRACATVTHKTLLLSADLYHLLSARKLWRNKVEAAVLELLYAWTTAGLLCFVLPRARAVFWQGTKYRAAGRVHRSVERALRGVRKIALGLVEAAFFAVWAWAVGALAGAVLAGHGVIEDRKLEVVWGEFWMHCVVVVLGGVVALGARLAFGR